MASRAHGQPYEGMVRDLCPPGGYPEVKRRPNPESIFQEALWPKSKFKPIDTIAKGRAQTQFRLSNEDMCDLYHACRPGPARNHNNKLVTWKMYFKTECERRAWEVHGGPDGLKYALDSLQWNRDHAARASGSKQGGAKVFASTPQKKSNAVVVGRPKGLRLESSMSSVEPADVKSEEDDDEDDSSSELIPTTTPQRKKLVRVSKKRGNEDDDDLVGGPPSTPLKKKFKPPPPNDDAKFLQLATPVSTLKKSSRDTSLIRQVDELPDAEILFSPSPTAKRSKSSSSSSSQLQAAGPSTPRKPFSSKDGPILPPTPSSSQKRGSIQQQPRENLGTLDCDWDSDHEVSVTWSS